MLIRLAALGAIGFAGYNYLKKHRLLPREASSDVRLAGGPLSEQAVVQHTADAPPQ